MPRPRVLGCSPLALLRPPFASALPTPFLPPTPPIFHRPSPRSSPHYLPSRRAPLTRPPDLSRTSPRCTSRRLDYQRKGARASHRRRSRARRCDAEGALAGSVKKVKRNECMPRGDARVRARSLLRDALGAAPTPLSFSPPGQSKHQNFPLADKPRTEREIPHLKEPFTAQSCSETPSRRWP